MIAAVKVESSALDSMKEKLKEVDALRNQISTFTKRLLDADQANLNLKTNLVKVQEAYTELKKQKAEVESSMVPMRQELNRTKEAYSKERMARLSAQQETAMLKEQIMRLEKINENLDRECKTIPPLIESNEMLKTDLSNVRKRFKEEKAGLLKQIKGAEASLKDVEAVKSEVRSLSLRLLDLASNGTNNAGSSSSSVGGGGQIYNNGGAGVGSNGPNTFSSNASMMLAQRQSNEQQMSYAANAASNASVASNVQYEYGFDDLDNEYLEEGEEDGLNSRGDDSMYDGQTLDNQSIDSIPSQVHISPPRNNKQGQHQGQGAHQQGHHQMNPRGGGKKKTVKRMAHPNSGSNRAAPNMMQQIMPDSSYSGGQGGGGQGQYGVGPSGGMVQSFSLPRIH